MENETLALMRGPESPLCLPSYRPPGGLLLGLPPEHTQAARDTVLARRPQTRSPQAVLGHPHLLSPWEAGSLGSSFLVSGSWSLPKGVGATTGWGIWGWESWTFRHSP